MKDDIITANPLYGALGKADKERQAAYRDYVNQSRPYDAAIDKAMFG